MGISRLVKRKRSAMAWPGRHASDMAMKVSWPRGMGNKLVFFVGEGGFIARTEPSQVPLAAVPCCFTPGDHSIPIPSGWHVRSHFCCEFAKSRHGKRLFPFRWDPIAHVASWGISIPSRYTSVGMFLGNQAEIGLDPTFPRRFAGLARAQDSQ